MRYFVFSDVHGYYSLLVKKLEELGYDESNDNHMLVSLGDNFDRGIENYKMYSFLKDQKEKNKIILIKGNHEDLFLKMLYRASATYIDERNGTYGTLIEFIRVFYDSDPYDMFYYNPRDVYNVLKEEGIIDFFYDMIDYFETKNYIFTHGFIPINEIDYTYKSNWRNSSKEEFASSRWLNGIKMSMDYHIKENNKKIVVGHYHTSYGHARKDYPKLSSNELRDIEFGENANFDIYSDDNIIAIDACTAYSKKMNILVVDDDKLC